MSLDPDYSKIKQRISDSDSNSNLISQMLSQLKSKPLRKKKSVNKSALRAQESKIDVNVNAFKNKKLEILKQKLSMQQSQLNHWKSKQQQLIENNLNLKIKLKKGINLKIQSKSNDDQLSFSNIQFNSRLNIQAEEEEGISILDNQSGETTEKRNCHLVVEQKQEDQDDFNLDDVNFMKLKKERYSNQQYNRNKKCTPKLNYKQNIDPNSHQNNRTMINSLIEWTNNQKKNKNGKSFKAFNTVIAGSRNEFQFKRSNLSMSMSYNNDTERVRHNMAKSSKDLKKQLKKASLNSTLVQFKKQRNSKASKCEKSPIKVIKKIYCPECDQNLAPNEYFSHNHSFLRENKVNNNRKVSPNKLQVSDLI